MVQEIHAYKVISMQYAHGLALIKKHIPNERNVDINIS